MRAWSNFASVSISTPFISTIWQTLLDFFEWRFTWCSTHRANASGGSGSHRWINGAFRHRVWSGSTSHVWLHHFRYSTLSHPALIYMSDKSLPLSRVRAKSNTGWINECRKLFPNTPWREAPSLNLGCCQSSAIMMKHLLSRSLQQSHVFPGNL